IGVPVFLIYGLWVLICLVVGPIQLLAGVRMMRGEPNNRLTWAAAFGGLAGAATFYCAPPALISFALGLGALLSEEEAG
ncbi:MAG: hypothetical protein KC912_19135, partial [Proteobacteria bacterium]|nr:hypothetical protein [Pseudomonadota bacterium]